MCATLSWCSLNGNFQPLTWQWIAWCGPWWCEMWWITIVFRSEQITCWLITSSPSVCFKKMTSTTLPLTSWPLLNRSVTVTAEWFDQNVIIIERSSDYQLDYIHFINDTVHSKNETSVIIVFQKPCKSHVLCRHHFLFSFHFVDQQELGHVHQCIKQFQSEHHLVSWVNRYWLLFSSFEYLPLFCCILVIAFVVVKLICLVSFFCIHAFNSRLPHTQKTGEFQ